ncbi:YidC/Oxa1 family membrane protein insertase [Diplocloster modestus]|uniref:YidC/Oxa1 family membrane protein insertase n=1 Tax=Diplocloster modestus TaxID=2850322 RepID=A0ABS6K5M1_9FIRM|nr:YidC/Oxa1 family membrane protein insertase [Diplocloster modestus]MBU9725741.1 YidC/Oxa1 family membrane protein insertase [Diplocloster modestus]
MPGILLTQSNTFIIGPIAKVLGWILDKIYIFLDTVFHVQNISVCIIIFTIVIYMCMLPLTVKQQKFSKLSAKMNPELMAIQKKYKNKKDQNSMMAMNEETKALYAKYGVSPTGGCLQLVIQMPILFALYRVIMNVPAYVASVKDMFMGLVEHIYSIPNYQDLVTEMAKNAKVVTTNFDTAEAAKNTIVDVLYKLQSADWSTLSAKITDFAGGSQSGLEQLVSSTSQQLTHINNFFGINIADAPWTIIKTEMATGIGIGIVIAIAIPVLSALTQMLSIKLMPQPAATGDNNTMNSTMKSMNLMMPIMSAVFCFTFPIGLGIYWVASAVARAVQQIAINKYMDRVDIEQLIAKNAEKAAKKREKKGLPPQKVNTVARQSLRNIEDTTAKKKVMSSEEREAAIQKSTDFYKNNEAKPGSIASKARMVQQFNDKNKKK